LWEPRLENHGDGFQTGLELAFGVWIYLADKKEI
jgi:hypothetical protein